MYEVGDIVKIVPGSEAEIELEERIASALEDYV